MAGTSVTPIDYVRVLEIDRQYKLLCAGPPKGQNLRQWFNKWGLYYTEAKATRHPDVETGLIIDYFISSLKQTVPTLAASSLYDLELRRLRMEETPTFMQILNVWRHICPEDLIGGSTESSSTPNKKSKDPLPKDCVCGKSHWYTNCFYLIESIRPKGWHSDPKIVKRIEEALKNPRVKANIDKARKRKDPREQALTLTTELPTEPQIKANDYDIKNCWILASASKIHVCNDPSRFNTTHSTTSNDYLISGSNTYPIQAYGTIDITFTSPTGKRQSITLKQAALIPGFFTNLVSFNRAQAANIHWDTEKDTLYTLNKGKRDHFCQLRRHNGLWIVEYNSSLSTSSSPSASPSTSVMFAASAATYTSSGPPDTPPS